MFQTIQNFPDFLHNKNYKSSLKKEVKKVKIRTTKIRRPAGPERFLDTVTDALKFSNGAGSTVPCVATMAAASVAL